MRQNHPFGIAGGTRGIDERRHLAGLGVNRRHRALGTLLEETLVGWLGALSYEESHLLEGRNLLLEPLGPLEDFWGCSEQDLELGVTNHVLPVFFELRLVHRNVRGPEAVACIGNDRP